MMTSTVPYRLQIHLAPDVRKALREAAFQHETSIQKLVTYWLVEKLREFPAGQHLALPDK